MSIAVSYTLNNKESTLNNEATNKISEFKKEILKANPNLKPEELFISYNGKNINDEGKLIKDIIGADKNPKFSINTNKGNS